MSKRTLIIIVVIALCIGGYYKWRSAKAGRGGEVMASIMCESQLAAEAAAKSKEMMEQVTKVAQGGAGREELKTSLLSWRNDFMVKLDSELASRGSSRGDVEAFCTSIVGDMKQRGEKAQAFMDKIHEKCPSIYNAWGQEQLSAIGFFLGMCAIKR